MKLIKEYDIPDHGDCYKCEASILTGQHGQDMYCLGFDVFVGSDDSYKQCQACKDWLKQQN